MTETPPPIEDVETALASVIALRRAADRMELHAVKAALDQGWTWADIAEALGVTKQAAHKRLSPLIARRS